MCANKKPPANQSKTLLSVIIPFHNATAFLPRTIDCLQKQTYKNFEAIFIDDGSSDDGGKLIQAVADPRFRLFRCASCRGVSAARNLGLKKMRGCFVTFVDADDGFGRQYFARMVEKIRANDADLVRFNYLRESAPGSGKFVLVDEFSPLAARLDRLDGKELVLEGDETRTFMEEMVISTISGSCCWTVFRRELLEGLSFCEELSCAEDLLFYLHVLTKTKKLLLVRDAYYRYYWHADSAVHAVSQSLDSNLESSLTGRQYMIAFARELPDADWLIRRVNHRIAAAIFYLIVDFSPTMSRRAFRRSIKRALPDKTLRTIRRHKTPFPKNRFNRECFLFLLQYHCYGLLRVLTVLYCKIKGLPLDAH